VGFALVPAMLLVPAGAALARSARMLTVCPSGCAYTTISAALAAANDGDTLNVGAGTYAGGVVVSKSVRIRGAGAAVTTISGGEIGVTIVAEKSVQISGLTISGAFTLDKEHEAHGILNAGSLSLTDAVVTRNRSGDPGPGLVGAAGIWNIGTLDIRRSSISANSTDGSYTVVGGIYNVGIATLTDTAVNGNSAFFGGGIVNAGTMTLTRTTVHGNTSAGEGGIANGGVMKIVDSTIDGNQAPSDGRGGWGGGIANGGTMIVVRTAITNNSAYTGGGIANSGVATIDRTTISGNTASDGSNPDGNGGGIMNRGTMTLTHSSVTKNRLVVPGAGRGGGIFNSSALTLSHTVVKDNQPTDCEGC
jgi:hypothetical protein